MTAGEYDVPTMREKSWDLPTCPAAIGATRVLIRSTLVEWGLHGLADDVQMIVTELHTNAMRHGNAPITLRLRTLGRCLGGEIADQGPAFTPDPRPASDDEENGRGLHIVAALSTAWGIDPAPHGMPGKIVWFTKCW